MSVSAAQVQQAVAAANSLRAQGYFDRAHAGDERAASYFARLVAFTANPDGLSHSWGALRKTGSGFNVEGYADGAIVCGNDPHDLNNVLKIVTQVGSDHAGIGDAVQERRPSDIWERPQPLTADQLFFLRTGGVRTPPPPAIKVLPKGEAFTALKALDAFYRAEDGLQRPEGIGGDMEAIAQWFYQLVIEGRTIEDVQAQIRNSGEWKEKHR